MVQAFGCQRAAMVLVGLHVRHFFCIDTRCTLPCSRLCSASHGAHEDITGGLGNCCRGSWRPVCKRAMHVHVSDLGPEAAATAVVRANWVAEGAGAANSCGAPRGPCGSVGMVP